MDVGYFLKDRIAFILNFYGTASYPFAEKKRKIEAGEYPYKPPYSEDGEPPFLNEWIEADEAIQVLGYACISTLSAAFHLYLKTWEAELRVPVGNSFTGEFKKGWFNGYKVYFATNFGVNFENAPADLAILEEIVLARNRIQHSDNLMTPRTSYSQTDINKLSHVLFVNDAELRLLSDVDEESESSWLFPPYVHITEENLMSATKEVEKFSTWLDDMICAYSR